MQTTAKYTLKICVEVLVLFKGRNLMILMTLQLIQRDVLVIVYLKIKLFASYSSCSCCRQSQRTTNRLIVSVDKLNFLIPSCLCLDHKYNVNYSTKTQ